MSPRHQGWLYLIFWHPGLHLQNTNISRTKAVNWLFSERAWLTMIVSVIKSPILLMENITDLWFVPNGKASHHQRLIGIKIEIVFWGNQYQSNFDYLFFFLQWEWSKVLFLSWPIFCKILFIKIHKKVKKAHSWYNTCNRVSSRWQCLDLFLLCNCSVLVDLWQ